MGPGEFRELGHRMVDWIAGYMERVESLPVVPRVRPGDLLAALPEHPPEGGLGEGGWDPVFDDLERVILPGLVHWQSPRFFGYFPCNASGPAILGELLSAGLGVQGMLWATSPAATELEMRVLDWLGELIGLPADFRFGSAAGGGCIQGTASESALVAMVAARARVRERLGDDARDRAFVAYASSEAHSSIVKAGMIAGICTSSDGDGRVRRIDVDRGLALRPDALESAIREDLDAGRVPFFVCATVGTTSTLAVDPLPAMAEVCRSTGIAERGAWLHVDAAHAGAAAVCPEHRALLAGVEAADSVCFNPHKWLLTNFDCDCFWTRDREALTRALSVTPPYLANPSSEAGDVIDYRDWQVPLGRRFRALKLWFVLRHYGAEGLRAHIRRHIALAVLFERLVLEDERFELAAPRALNLVCFRLRAGDDANLRLLEALERSGEAYLTHTAVPDGRGGSRRVLRMAVGAPSTEERHVRAAWQSIRSLADALT